MKTLYLSLIVVTAASAAAACGRSKPEETANMHGGMPTDSGMIAMMPVHLDSMLRLNPAQMDQMMPEHERRMSQMMDQMGSEMRQMKMGESAGWIALNDSVKQDLAELPSLNGEALSAAMRAHAARVNRLVRAHEEMMTDM